MMYIECHLNIKNVVLRNVLTTYISKTPFLRASQELITDIENLALYKGDLIIIEFNSVHKDLIDDLVSALSNKLFILLMDLRLPYFKKRPIDNVIFLGCVI